ncbi:MAG: biopolymer transporter ExbD [Planctomycetota bacterium]
MRMLNRGARKSRGGGGDDAEVMLSPLIDCVFLLLIFFLVTSVLKRYERMIPVTLADPTAAVAVVADSDAYLLGLAADGTVHREAGRDERGIVRFVVVSDPVSLASEMVSTRGPDAPIELVVEQQTPFQTVIDFLDALQHAGLTRVRSRVRDGEL